MKVLVEVDQQQGVKIGSEVGIQQTLKVLLLGVATLADQLQPKEEPKLVKPSDAQTSLINAQHRFDPKS